MPTRAPRPVLVGIAGPLVLFLSCAWSWFRPAEVAAAQPVGRPTLVVQDVRVIDGTDAAPLASRDLWIEGDRIAAIVPTGAREIPADVLVIDGRGRTVLPGLIDMHAHVALGPVGLDTIDGQPVPVVHTDPEVGPRSLRTLLAHGVTTIRDPGGSTETALALRERLARGELVGPRLLVAGRVIDRVRFPGLVDTVSGPDQVRAAVRRQAEAGVDWIKLYTTLDADELRAGIDEAHAHGLPAVAHLQSVSWTTAARLGLDAIVHIVPGSVELVPAARRVAARPILESHLALYAWFLYADLDSPEIVEMIDALVEHDVTVDPTLAVFEKMVRGDEPEVTRDSPELALAAPSLVQNWRRSFTFNIGWTEENFVAAEEAWPKMLELTARLWRAGVRLTAGTDANNPWTVPGPSLHRELELLAEAGIPPLEVLRIATRNAAEVLGLSDELGTLQPGLRADAVLVAGDPSSNVSAVREVVVVFQGGVPLRPADLLAELGTTTAAEASPP
jgi:imidazolonepropionase-like amidohydrolase